MPAVQNGIRNSVFENLSLISVLVKAGLNYEIRAFVRLELDNRTKMSDLPFSKVGSAMDKRDRFIAEIRSEARAMGLTFRVDYRKGKGGHAMVYVGDRLTTLPSREIDPKTARKIRKHLGLAE
jgi:hypothetical protein